MMLLTEEEACTKWCPHTRNGREAGCNRTAEEGSHPYEVCIASDCMAWRYCGEQPAKRAKHHGNTFAEWMAANPPPDSDQAYSDWATRADLFAKSLTAPAVPSPDPRWEWLAGYDEGEFFALWYFPPVPQGFCGLAGRPE